MRRARGLLRPSEENLLGRGARFVLAGGTVAGVYLLTTTLLASVAGVPFQVALPIGFCAGLAVHFTLQRWFVWSHAQGFALPLRYQAGRYLVTAALQYGLTALSTAFLPALLGASTEVVYLATASLATFLNFVVFRRLIFHPKLA